MNRAQWSILKAGALFLLAQGLFPPWKLISKGGSYERDWQEGFAFILMPPAPNPNALTYKNLQTHIDWSLLLQLWGVTAVVVVIMCVIFRRREGEGDAGYFEMLKRRKLISSLLIGLGAPVPFVGFSVIYFLGLVLFGEVGHAWAGVALFVLGPSLVGFTVGSLMLSLSVQWVKSRRAKVAITVAAGLVLFATSILGPVITNARQRKEHYVVYNRKIGAFRTLESLNFDLRQYKAKHGEFPESLSNLTLRPKANESGYKFEYVPARSGDGRLASYVIYADPLDDNDNRFGWPVHFYTDQNQVVYGCIACERAGPSDFVYR